MGLTFFAACPDACKVIASSCMEREWPRAKCQSCHLWVDQANTPCQRAILGTCGYLPICIIDIKVLRSDKIMEVTHASSCMVRHTLNGVQIKPAALFSRRVPQRQYSTPRTSSHSCQWSRLHTRTSKGPFPVSASTGPTPTGKEFLHRCQARKRGEHERLTFLVLCR